MISTNEENNLNNKIKLLEKKNSFYKLKRYEKNELKSLRKRLSQINININYNKILETKNLEENEIESIEPDEEKFVIEEYKENHKIKEYEQLPNYISEKEVDSRLEKECAKIVNNLDNNLPLIIINDESFDSFVTFLEDYVKYEDYKFLYPLKNKLLVKKNSIENYNILHKEKDGNNFFAETLITSNVNLFNQEKINEIIQSLKIMSKDFKTNFVNEIKKWVRTVFIIMSEYILFKLKANPLYFCCSKCEKPVLYMDDAKINLEENNIIKNEKTEKKIEKEKKIINKIIENKKERSEFKSSFNIANNLINLMNFFSNNNNNKTQHLIANPPKNTKNNTGNLYDEKNILFYDENKYADCELFEKEISGTFLFITNIKNLGLVLKHLKSKNCQKKFILIITGQYCENILNYLKNNYYLDIFHSCCIYTQNQKYNYLQSQFNIIKGFFKTKKEICNYIINCPNLGIFPSIKLLNFKKYSDRYYNFHKIISSQYGILNGNIYNSAINILDEYLTSVNSSNKNTLMNALKVFGKGESNSQLIIKGYTGNDYYRDFNRWLYEYDSLAYEKTGYFLSGLIYSLNLYGSQQNTFENKDVILYRGLRLSYIDVLPYEKNLGNIISFPNFTSSSTNLNIAESFSGRTSSIDERKKNNIFSVILKIKNNHKSGWISNAINVKNISNYPNEEERIFQPFTFYKVTKIDINTDNYTADIDLETIGRKTILEDKIKTGGKIRYNIKEGIMENY